jgi:DNA-binding transcriptional ArsR family regulator
MRARIDSAGRAPSAPLLIAARLEKQARCHTGDISIKHGNCPTFLTPNRPVYRLDAALLLHIAYCTAPIASSEERARGSGRALDADPCHAQARMILKDMLNQSASLDRVFQALADPARRLMVERLSRGPASVSELAQPLAMTLPAVVQHLGVLQACGLVRSRKVGRVRTCRIEPAALRTAEDWIARRRASWERRLDRLGEFLAEQRHQPKQRRKS